MGYEFWFYLYLSRHSPFGNSLHTTICWSWYMIYMYVIRVLIVVEYFHCKCYLVYVNIHKTLVWKYSIDVVQLVLSLHQWEIFDRTMDYSLLYLLTTKVEHKPVVSKFVAQLLHNIGILFWALFLGGHKSMAPWCIYLWHYLGFSSLNQCECSC